MSHRYCQALAMILAAAVPAAAQSGGHGIQVRAACYVDAGTGPRLLADLSCESAMNCWGDPGEMTLIDAETGAAVAAGPGNLAYVDDAGNVQAEPPMRGTIHAVWATVLDAPPPPKGVQLAIAGAAATATFTPAADCAALPAAAVKRLSGS